MIASPSNVHDHFRQPAVAVWLDLQAVVGDRLDLVAQGVPLGSSGSPQLRRQAASAIVHLELARQQMLARRSGTAAR